MYKPPNILVLTGITSDDYESFESKVQRDRLEDAVEKYQPKREDYDKIPEKFIDLKSWPESIKIHCHECSLSIMSRPKFIPTYFIENDKKEVEIGVQGMFCSFACCATHLINTVHKKEDLWKKMDMLCALYTIFTGKHPSTIKPSPNKTEMEQYGGLMTIEKFREEVDKIESSQTN